MKFRLYYLSSAPPVKIKFFKILYFFLEAVRTQLLNGIFLLQVIQIIPDNWSIALLSEFLKKAVRTNMHLHRMTRVERMMSRGENLLVKEICIDQQREPVVMTEEK